MSDERLPRQQPDFIEEGYSPEAYDKMAEAAQFVMEVAIAFVCGIAVGAVFASRGM